MDLDNGTQRRTTNPQTAGTKSTEIYRTTKNKMEIWKQRKPRRLYHGNHPRKQPIWGKGSLRTEKSKGAKSATKKTRAKTPERKYKQQESDQKQAITKHRKILHRRRKLISQENRDEMNKENIINRIVKNEHNLLTHRHPVGYQAAQY